MLNFKICETAILDIYRYNIYSIYKPLLKYNSLIPGYLALTVSCKAGSKSATAIVAF